MEGNVDGVRRRLEELGDLARAEVGAVAERDELAVLRLETGDGVDDGEALADLVREILRRRMIIGLGVLLWQARTRTPKQPALTTESGSE